MLTGIRPAKIASGLLGRGFSAEETQEELRSYYLVDAAKAKLCVDVVRAQIPIVAASPPNAISIYIGIPFCPSVCHYCSFSGYPAGRYRKQIGSYVAALIKEIEYLATACRDKHVENIYIGGGTPTVLGDEDFEQLLCAVAASFPVDNLLEYTIEAGRPDTITRQKLAIMKRHDVSRISINPQTLHDRTLEKIGRGHSVADFFKAYEMAQSEGFVNINVDLILGLPNETPEDVRGTLYGIAALGPKSCTIHTLAVKRASKFHEVGMLTHAEVAQMQEMLALSVEHMADLGLAPYYMYRQKNSCGNFENVGYAAPDFEGRYNIQMMEETHSIYAAGAGAVTKLVDVEQGRIERIFNLRNPVEYMEKVDEMIARKINL